MADSPTPDEIRASRQVAGMTQTQAAAVVDRQRDAWARWEAGRGAMPPALWTYWLIQLSNRAAG